MELLIPAHIKRASKPIRVVFYHNPLLNRILVGFPEQFPAPIGWNKIVCTTAAEVNTWSKRLRLQERCDEERTDEEREMIEGPIRDYVRKELITKMMNARNEINRQFCRYALDRLDEMEAKNKVKRESFMHIESEEDGR